MSGHTPGPWFGRSHFNPILVQGASEVGLEIAFACGGGNPNRGEYQANARLIAAAPELLEACEGVETLYAELGKALPALAGTPSYDVVQGAVRKARAAISKATGEGA